MSDKNNQDDDIGYGKPPKHSQFKKGRSGNPNGRPKGRKNSFMTPVMKGLFKDVVTSELAEEITASENGKAKKLSKMQVVVKALINKAAQGQIAASKKVIELTQAVEKENSERIQTLIDYKYNMLEYIRRSKKTGMIPNIHPIHPENIHINPETGEVVISTPLTEEETENINWLQSQFEDRTQEIILLENEREAALDEDRDWISEEINFHREIVDLIETHLYKGSVDVTGWI